MAAQRVGRTQGERSAAMQKRLLDATVAALYEKGYGGTTTLEVQERAGVSRGALLHHYASRSALMVAAVEHLTRERLGEVISRTQGAAPKRDRVAWAVGVIWSTFEGPLFAASLELWLAARNDEELLAALAPQERVLGQGIRSMAGEVFGEDLAADPNFSSMLEVLLDAMRGAAARTVLRNKASESRLIATWVTFVTDQLSASLARASA